MRRWIIVLLCCPLISYGMVEESGSLYGFLLDSCQDCAYDNWLSHVSERNIRFDYNDYGPPNLDPVTNGFGGFTYIPENAAGNQTLARWRTLFEFAIENQWHSVDSMLILYGAQWNYELVHLSVPARRQSYYILRERLDSSFVDTNGNPDPSNDVIGGFNKAWGVFVFNPTPRHTTAVVEVPHPEDDYMAPPVGTDLFVRGEFAILMIAGAGREVLWDTTHTIYDNAYSYSDPSRNGRQPFAILHEVAVDAWDTPPVSPFFSIQVHSYDHDEHGRLGDMQMSAFFDDTSPNPPIRDVGAHRDFVHALPLFPIQGFDGDNTISTCVNEYLTLWCDPPYAYFGDDTTVPLSSFNEYLGAPENQQAIYCHDEHDELLHTENFIHVELDEYPDALWQPEDMLRWLPGGPPARLSNFRNVLDYYSPFVAALDSALSWHEVPDTHPPVASRIRQVTEVNGTTVELMWKPPAFDQHFDTYEIFYDTVAISASSPSKTRTSSISFLPLGNQTTNRIQFSNLISPVDRYRFAIRAKDVLNQWSELSREWSIIDSVIQDLTISVVGDSLKLKWSAQYYDSLYEIRKYPPGISDYTIIGTTDISTFTFSPVGSLPNSAYIIEVKKIIRS